MYVYKTRQNTYAVRKFDSSTLRVCYYGTYKTLEEAQQRRDTLISEGVIKPTPKRTLPKYIYKVDGKYLIYKKVDGKQVYYGTFHSEEDAYNRVQQLIVDNWEDNTVHRKRKITPEWKYISKVKRNGKYRIQHGGESYGTYNTLQDAQAERDYLESIDWDYDNME